MNLGTRIALLVGAAVLLATAITGTGLAFSSRSVGRDVIDRELLSAAAAFNGLDGAPDPVLMRAAFELRVARCDDAPDSPALDSTQRGAQDRNDDRRGNDDRPREPTNERLENGDQQRNNGGDRGRATNRPPSRFLQLRSGLQLVEPDGATTTSCLAAFEPVANELDIARNGFGQFLRSADINGDRYRVLTVGHGTLGAVQFAEELQVVERAMQGLFRRIVAFGLIGAVLAAVIGWFWARRATRPVRELSATAERVAVTQDLGERISVTGSDEIGTLAASFNRMLVSLDTSRAQQRRFVQDASHEFRTPLTSIRTNIELLQRHPTIDEETRAAILSDIQAELEELSDLSAELVDSAAEVTNAPDARLEVDFEALVESCITRARRRHSRPIDLAVASASTVLVDPAAVSRAIDNLVGNAAKFTPADGAITVELQAGTITVSDTGPGIPETDLPNIFDRFYRATTARTEPGSGLGLSIVKQVVDAHDGQVFASNRPGGGARVGFTLPVTH